MYRFEVSIHARPDAPIPTASIELDGVNVPVLDVTPAALAEPLGVTFDEAYARLERLERMLLEPDGSLVWRGADWQLDGVLHERERRLLFVELKGTCPSEALDRVLAALGCPAASVVFQLSRQAVFLDETAFRRFAAV